MSGEHRHRWRFDSYHTHAEGGLFGSTMAVMNFTCQDCGERTEDRDQVVIDLALRVEALEAQVQQGCPPEVT